MKNENDLNFYKNFLDLIPEPIIIIKRAERTQKFSILLVQLIALKQTGDCNQKLLLFSQPQGQGKSERKREKKPSRCS